MREDIAGPRGASSRPMWETLEGMVREKAQEFIQQIGTCQRQWDTLRD